MPRGRDALDYAEFLAGKRPSPIASGLSRTPELSEHLLPIQAACSEFALRIGRAGIFLATGLGKSLVQLEFSTHAADATNGRALILTPLAVALQFKREADRFGYGVELKREYFEQASRHLDGVDKQTKIAI